MHQYADFYYLGTAGHESVYIKTISEAKLFTRERNFFYHQAYAIKTTADSDAFDSTGKQPVTRLPVVENYNRYKRRPISAIIVIAPLSLPNRTG